MPEVTDLIIGGVTRAATTSLFRYLSDHPRICASTYKENRFFLDADYPLPRLHSFADGLEKRDVFFRHCIAGQVRLEAEPDYLFSSGTAARIAQMLPNARLVFILREPISRLVSWYKFALQNAFLRPESTFEEYVRMQFERANLPSPVAQHLRALEQGRYASYVAQYLETLGPDRMLVVKYEDLSSHPGDVVTAICGFAGLDASPYTDYQFEVFNASIATRSARTQGVYQMVSRWARMRTVDKPWIRRSLRQVKTLLEPVYLRLNRRPSTALVISKSLSDELAAYYSTEPAAIARVLGLDGWSWDARSD